MKYTRKFVELQVFSKKMPAKIENFFQYAVNRQERKRCAAALILY